MTLLENAFTLIPAKPSLNLKECLKKKSKVRWEWRSFWSKQDLPIPLAILTDSCKSWENFEQKERTDIYLWEKDHPRNIKVRKNKIHIKPVIEVFEKMTAFGPKEKLKFPLSVSKVQLLFPRLRGEGPDYKDLEQLQGDLQVQGYKIVLLSFIKNIYKVSLTSSLELELSLFSFQGREWKSVCIEGPCYQTVKSTASHIISSWGQVMGYTEFLHQVLQNDA